MEPRCHWIMLVDSAEKIESKINLTGIFNAMTPARVPFIMARPFYLVTHWSGPRNTKLTYQVRIIEPEGRTDPPWWWCEIEIEFSGSGGVYSISPPIEAFEFPAYGDYRFDVLLHSVVQVSTTLSILPKI